MESRGTYPKAPISMRDIGLLSICTGSLQARV